MTTQQGYTEEEYDRWLNGQATITELTKDAIRILGHLIEETPSMTRAERYASVYAILVTSAPADLVEQLNQLIRSGGR